MSRPLGGVSNQVHLALSSGVTHVYVSVALPAATDGSKRLRATPVSLQAWSAEFVPLAADTLLDSQVQDDGLRPAGAACGDGARE